MGDFPSVEISEPESAAAEELQKQKRVNVSHLR